MRAALNVLVNERGVPATARELLGRVLESAVPFELDQRGLRVRTDPRWYATLPADAAHAPAVELRRWPGDSVIALYATAPGMPLPPLAGAGWEAEPGVAAPWRGVRGMLETVDGARAALWLERPIDGEGMPNLGALLVAGDAGFGSEGRAGLEVELRAVVERIEIRREVWARQPAIPAGERVVLPMLSAPAGDGDEDLAPWQVVDGPGFTLGIPPGVRARRPSAAMTLPREVPGAVLWLRGRFVDTADERVAIGDGERFGYVAVVEPADAAWIDGERPPLASPSARRVAVEPYPLAAERAGASRASAERWSEPGFSGDWLVFRLVFGERALEVGLPVLLGRRSPSLYWIPATWRVAGEPPAPPPVDPAARFGIRFERLGRNDRSRQPWTEGFLHAPGLDADIPRGWLPAASLRTADGFPIRIVDPGGATVGAISRLGPGEAARFGAEVPAAWRPLAKPGRYGASRAYERPDGSRLLVSPQGHAFAIEPVSGARSGDDRDRWQILLDSLRLRPLPG